MHELFKIYDLAYEDTYLVQTCLKLTPNFVLEVKKLWRPGSIGSVAMNQA
jgi:hypothetical protein